MSNKIYLIHIITGLDFGGAEQIVYDLARLADTEKYNVRVICLSNRCARKQQFIDQDINLEVWGLTKFSIWSFLKNLWSLHKSLTNSSTIVHAHLHHALFSAYLLKILSPTRKLVFSYHSNIKHASLPIVKSIIRYTNILRNADVLFSNLELPGFGHPNSVIIPNGIQIPDYSFEPPIHLEPFRFLLISQFRKAKNLTSLAAIAQALNVKTKHKFEIWIAGDGEEKDKIIQSIADLNMESQIKLLGLITDKITVYQQCHAYMLVSHYEGMPLSVLEAGAIGMPCISTPVGSLPFYFSNEEMYFAKIENMVETMLLVMQEYPVALHKGKLSRKKIASHFSVQQMVSNHEDLYNQLIPQH